MRLPASRRAMAAVADQAISSGTNFLTSLIAMWLLGPRQFGGLTLALALGYLVLGVARAVIGDPLLAHASAQADEDRRRMVRDATTTALLLGVVSALVVAGFGMVTGPHELVWVAPWLVPLLVQDAGRYAALSARHPQGALVLDGVWAGAQGAALVGFWAAGWVSTGMLLAAWGIGSLAGAAWFVAFDGVNPVAGRPAAWLAESRHLSGWFTPTALLAQTQYNVVVFLIAALLGKAATGGLRAMQMLVLQPVQTFLLAMTSLLVPRYARQAAAGAYSEVRATTLWLTRLLAGAALLVLVGIPVGHLLVDHLFTDYRRYLPLLLPIALQTGVYLVTTPFTAALRGMQRGRAVFLTQVAFFSVTIPAVVAGALAFGLSGAAWGLLAGAVAQLAAATWQYGTAVTSKTSPQSAPKPPNAPPDQEVRQSLNSP
ncbi:MAG: hypothetical protein ACJ73S_28360 [Mycobacteriales bacterium]